MKTCLPDVLSIKLNTDINATLGCNRVFITVSRLDTLQHGEHERLQSFVKFVVLGFVICIANVIHNMCVKKLAQSFVPTTKKCEKQWKKTKKASNQSVIWQFFSSTTAIDDIPGVVDDILVSKQYQGLYHVLS